MTRCRNRQEALDSTLLFIAQQGWLRTGKPFLDSLVEFLGRTLDVAYVLVDELLPSGSRARSIALYANGEPAHNIEYDLAFTPCENVMNKRLCCYPDGLRERFPEDALLVQMKAESYMGIPLWDSKGVPLGLIAIMDTRPLSDMELMKEVIQTVALRTAHELERRRDDARLAAYYADLESTVAERTADLHDANKRLEEANKEIVSVNEKLRTMTGMVSHDIANQLLVLNGNLALLEMKCADPGSTQIMEKLRRSVELISKTIEVSRNYRIKGPSPIWHDVMGILDGLRSPKVSIDPCLRGLSIFADPLLEKVFFNLLDNSEKHGGGVSRITVSCARDEGALQIIWQDDGAGVPVDRKQNIFDPPQMEGRMHGLALIRRILMSTGMVIEENGKPGEGGRFVITVPAGTYMFSSE